MTGPHLTPEREAEIRAMLRVGQRGTTYSVKKNEKGVYEPIPDSVRPALSGQQEAIRDLLAALDAEREAHQQTRTALTDSTALLTNATVVLRRILRTDALSKELARQAQENQRILGLAVAEADKPHDGNER